MAIAMQIRETQQIFIIPLPHPPCCVLCAFPFSPTTTTPTTREILFCISALSLARGKRNFHDLHANTARYAYNKVLYTHLHSQFTDMIVSYWD